MQNRTYHVPTKVAQDPDGSLHVQDDNGDNLGPCSAGILHPVRPGDLLLISWADGWWLATGVVRGAAGRSLQMGDCEPDIYLVPVAQAEGSRP